MAVQADGTAHACAPDNKVKASSNSSRNLRTISAEIKRKGNIQQKLLEAQVMPTRVNR